ncbi:MAG: NAD-dependent protein deacylase [Deltaproteobacteria bacterium]|nr:NAD-dependent protein deacylase [Deltaproteobacteria bacterium]
MNLPDPNSEGTLVILSGAGLSAASGVPTFRDANGLWEGYEVTQVATPEAWHLDPTLVRRFYDERRLSCGSVEPNPGHIALCKLQQEWGSQRVILVTQNIDGLLTLAGAESVIEMHGSLFRLRCEASANHPTPTLRTQQNPEATCDLCGRPLRPDVVWFGEMPYFMDDIYTALSRCTTFVSVGTSGLVYPAAGFSAEARSRGAVCIEVNPQPAGGPYHHVVAEGSETALPRIVDQWLRGAGTSG